MVLAAQQWVNSTYRSVSGYNACPEDGKTGWPVMYSLTRALQHELGISALSDAFGPTTLDLYAKHGSIGLSEKNANLIKIARYACYCKGYDPGGITDTWGTGLQSAITDLTTDCGIADLFFGIIPPKVMKALLTMDAYVVLSPGTAEVRAVQQWLNHQYYGRTNFFVIPCDGVFSRDVQKALLLAIQFELGMTDAQATGVFGPGTQTGLKGHTVRQGDSGAFVRLFSAATLVNGYGTFGETFSAGLTDAVKKFQSFSQLPATGIGDYATWAQLLVSTGDPTRSATAADCITTVTAARAQALKAAGYGYVGRYLDERSPATLNKKIQPGELATIFAGGLKVFPISQYYGGAASYFSYSQGFTDALGAHDAAVRYGFDQGTVFYFAVDYDATQAEIEAHVLPYFYGVVGGLASRGKRYIHGVYGSRNVCQQVTNQTQARYSFVSGMSTGFSGNMGFPLPSNWSFNQIQTLTAGSGSGAIEIDKDVYRTGSDQAVSKVGSGSSTVAAFIAYVQKLYDLAKVYDSAHASLRVMEYLRQPEYTGVQWTALIGGIDEGFVSYVAGKGVARVTTFKDPFYGVDVRASHFGASCNGAYLGGKPSGTATNAGDVAGWAGDLMTFYGEWRRDSDSYASGATYCSAKLAKVDVSSTFKLTDLIEDADAYNIAMAVRAGTSIADAVRANLTTGYLSRFKRYFQGRFGGLAGTAAQVARDALALSSDAKVTAARIYLCRTTGGVDVLMPTVLDPLGKLAPFCQGFGDMLAARVGQENAKVAKLRAEGKVP